MGDTEFQSRLSSGMSKVAAKGVPAGGWKSYGKGLGFAIAAGAGGMLAAMGIQSAINRQSRMGKRPAFKKMLRGDSELKRMYKGNPAKVQAHYDTLFRFNPEMAKDPLVAGSFVKGTAAHDYLAHTTVKDLIDARKAFMETGSKLPQLGKLL